MLLLVLWLAWGESGTAAAADQEGVASQWHLEASF